MLKNLWALIQRYFIAGLLLWLPIWVTLIFLKFLIGLMEGTVDLLPEAYQPQNLFGFNIPGLGLFISIVTVLITGMLITNILGRKLVSLWEALLARIPFVRAVYSSVKQVSKQILSPEGNSFRKVIMIRFPHADSWSLAFQAGEVSSEVQSHFEDELIQVFIPTTPNPTGGYLMVMPRKNVIELKMKVEDGIKYIVSLGVMQPGTLTATKQLTKAKRTRKAKPKKESTD